VRTDVTDEASGKAAIAAAMDGYGSLQGLVNCAGIVYGEKDRGQGRPHSLAGFARADQLST
jgi:NAD(P)-dependent dehydrogenase (short-subunit alcohol dehydrogenase family)